MHEFTDLMAHLTVNNSKFLAIIIGLIFNGIKEFQSKRYRQFFTLFEKVIRIQDELVEERLAGFLKLVEALKVNEQYSLDSNIIQQWLVILVNRNPCLREFLGEHGECLEYLHKLSTKKTPSEDIARKNVTLLPLRVSTVTSCSTNSMESSSLRARRGTCGWLRTSAPSMRVSSPRKLYPSSPASCGLGNMRLSGQS